MATENCMVQWKILWIEVVLCISNLFKFHLMQVILTNTISISLIEYRQTFGFQICVDLFLVGF